MIKKAVSFDEFKHSINSTLPHYLVIGHPISHSLSPLMHSVSLSHYSMDAEYIAVDLPPHSITDFISWINRDAFLGCNITIPWKQQLLNIPDLLSPEVHTTGAMNTISKKENGRIIRGDNTDIYGFKAPLKLYKDRLEYSRAILFGTGGASLAVQYALNKLGYDELILVSRTPVKATTLETTTFTKVVDYNQWQEFAEETELFINTTPLGMGTLNDQSPVREDEGIFLLGKLCYDLVYNPAKTRFLRIAETSGADILNGLDMLIHQGSRSFEIWTGQPFPIEKVKKELKTYFKE